MNVLARHSTGSHDEPVAGDVELRVGGPGVPDAHSSESVEVLARWLRTAEEKYPGVMGPIRQEGPWFAIPLTCPRGARSARFGLWLGELDRQGQLLHMVASYLAAVHHVLVSVREPSANVLEVLVSDSTTPSGLNRFLNGLDSVLEILAHGRSDLLLQHLTGRLPPDEMPFVEDREEREEHPATDVEADAVVSVLFQPVDFPSLARLDASLLAYDDEDAGAVGRVLGELLQPFLLDSARMTVGRKAVRVDHICLPGLLRADSRAAEESVLAPALRLATKPGRHFVALCRNTALRLGDRLPHLLAQGPLCDGASTALLLLQRVLDTLIGSGGLKDHRLTLELVGADPRTEAAFRARTPWLVAERAASAASTDAPRVDVVVLFPAARPSALELRPDSVVIDLFGTWSLRPRPEVLAKNIVYVRGASVRLAGEAVVSTPSFAPDRVEPALLEALLRELDAEASSDGLAHEHRLEIGGIRGFWGEIRRAEWDAFHSRRRGELARFQVSGQVTAANPGLASLPDGATNICEYIFREAHLRSGSCLVDPQSGQSATYAELRRLAAAYARRFRALGLRQGDVVALAAPDGISSVAVMLGCFLGGWVFAPLNHTASAVNFEAMLSSASPRLVLHAASTVARHLPVLSTRRCAELASFLPPDALDGVEGDVTPLPVSPEAPAVMLFTSGSTGGPKAVTHTHADFITCSRNYAPYVVELRPDDRVYTPSPTFFAYGLNNLLLSLSAGATHVISVPRNGGMGVAEILARNEVTVLFAVPAVYKLIISKNDRGLRLPKLRLCISAGEKLPLKLYREARSFFSVNVLDGIGCTEAISTFISNRESYVAPGCTGVVVPGFEVKLVNPRGELCRVGEVGVLWVRGGALTRGYVNAPDLTEKHFVDGWFNTQDMFFMDAEYRLYNVGRAGSVIKINSCWFSPEMMESVLQSHPAVKECAVCVVIDDYGLPRPKAFIVTGEHERSEPELEHLWAELRVLSKEKLGKDHYPHLFATIKTLPRTSSGKLMRSELAKLLTSGPP
uniref:Benzoate-CoA ligase n=1 Tax=Cystobacter sp. Cbv34 TaxID=1679164 RepID=A0A0H4NXN3_9BACT|nr:benzoate-CoA ligase [Cystobacter sp. Cbv34]QQZ45558.1 CysL [synthetic construct]